MSDAAYMDAVAKGDMKTAQRMVDAAAKKAGYTVGPVWHGTKGTKKGKFPFTVFDTKRRGKLVTEVGDEITGSFFTEVEKYAKGVALYQTGMSRDGRAVVGRFFLKEPEVIDRGDEGWKYREFVAKEPSQIKSADPVTYDDAGRALLYRLGGHNGTGHIAHDFGGQPCWSGSRYFIVDDAGEAFRCYPARRYRVERLGNLVQGTVQLHEAARPCLYRSCHCTVPIARGMMPTDAAVDRFED